MMNNSITILNVGHGNSAIINCNGMFSIIDAGSKSGVLEFLKTNGIENIEYIFISHSDRDHIEGIIALLADENITIKKIILNTDSMKGSVLWEDLLCVIQNHHREENIEPYLGVIERDSFQLSDAQLKIMAPSFSLSAKGPGAKIKSGEKINSNSVSLCIILEYSGINIVCFPGDLDGLGFSQIPEKLKKELSCDYLVFPHHGGKCKGDYIGYYRKLLNYVNPSTIIFSNGRGRAGNPRQDVLNLIKEWKKGTEILCTQLSKRCSAGIPNQNNNVFDHLGSKRCAGNISIFFGSENKIIQPNLEIFNGFKESLPTPQCQQE